MANPLKGLSPFQLLDLPPVWLLAFLGLGKAQVTLFPMGPSSGGVIGLLAGGLVGGGIILIVLAFLEFRKHSTTIVPHQEAEVLITSGVFKRTRNPIYLADLMLLAGFLLQWGAWLSLALVPILMWVLEKRFIVPEENRLRRKFRADFARYERKTRRWL
ncbi:MAG: isoprenylcysteine carboxylmethyltransferase family protein [Dinoroseobacter sp.]|nr:isoprenylcysteine carboxylmethyltransferase family protein [Dinoroseobacter sp.]